jgi:hypothetical protein
MFFLGWRSQLLGAVQANTNTLNTVLRNQGDIMATLAQILAAQQQEKTDLSTLAGLIQQLLTAFANGNLTPAQASGILTEMQSEDSTIESLAASINTALGNTPASGSSASGAPSPAA